MNAVFADTFYFLALLNLVDEAHAAAERFESEETTTLVTTAWVLTEVADGLATTAGRRLFAAFLRDLEAEPQVGVIQPSEELWRKGIDL